ncbi:hypothetical protein AcV7_000973 [Taiwanofungus camphoratus]|nr:hypothetical protein AcV7_000973 [Antrodia cinnamomea]
MATPFAFVTLVTSDYYLPGALAVAAALKDLHPNLPQPPEVEFQTVCLVTPESVDVSSIKLLRRAFNIVIGVELIEQEDEKGLQLLGRPDLSHVLTKLHIFRLTQFAKLIFLDADVLPIRPLSHLFTLPHEFAAVPDVGWPDIFNSGVLVLNPGHDKFAELMQLLKTRGSWDGGDQGLLNEWRGADWHHLSFTYNTTPTAAYTYAPAYERFGSHISAIHFIGPNKPWASIPFRAPGTKSAHKPVQSVDAIDQIQPQQLQQQRRFQQLAYDYDSLVDRWYDVYDRHYRSDAPTARAEFEVRRYASVWDGTSGSEMGAELPPVAAAVASPSGGALGLEDLRKIAVEGMGSFSGASIERDKEEKPREGEYRSMPLEGRVDLMRPRMELEPELEKQDKNRKTRIEEQGQQDNPDQTTPRQEEYRPLRVGDGAGGWGGSRMEALPTPGPNELPPAPYHHGHSLPPTPFYSPLLQRHPQQQQQQQQQHQRPPEQPQGQPGQHQYSENQSQGEQQSQPPGGHQDQQRYHQSQQLSSQPQQESHHDQHPPTIHHHRSTSHHHHHHDHFPPRPPSPPKLSWNPAIEPPPHNPPATSAFPADTYFPNVWDAAPSQHADATHQSFPPPPAHVPAPHSDAFFHPPPPAHIPEPLVLGGEYAGVIGGTPGQPIPDRNKVHTVFPWEEKPRHVPRRVFPATDSPPPSARYIETGQSPLPPEELPASQVTPSRPILHVHTPSPPVGLPVNLAYSNAWDSVPSIQRYASRLVRPQHRSAMQQGGHVQDDGWRRWERERERVVQAKQDTSSMDGDDEDEGEEDEKGGQWGESESSRERSGSTSKRSRTSSTSTVSSSKGKKYRGRGVQTVPVETRSQGVQVNTSVGSEPAPSKGKDARPPVGTGMWRDVPSTARLLPPVTMREFRMDPDQMAVATPVVTHSLRQTVAFPSQASPTGMWSPHTLGSPRTYSPPKASPPKVPSPPKGASPRKLSLPQQTSALRKGTIATPPSKPASPVIGPAATPSHGTPSPKLSKLSSPHSPPLARSSSNDTALTSSPSTQAVPTPSISPEGTPVMGSIRKSGRVWDPARGVDVFKRSSEEVLAKFLRMGSFDDDERRSSQVQ